MDKHDINLNNGQVTFSNSMMGIFEDLKPNEVDPEVIVDKIGLMNELPNEMLISQGIVNKVNKNGRFFRPNFRLQSLGNRLSKLLEIVIHRGP